MIALPLIWQFLRNVCNILYHVIIVIISRNLNSYLKLLFSVPPEITIPPEPRPLLTIGKNYTLTCNASGDPLPKITWTKDGIPAEEFNVTGYKLHLTDVKLKDVGSYRCTASNGYGVDASNASIVGVNCKLSVLLSVLYYQSCSSDYSSAIEKFFKLYIVTEPTLQVHVLAF